VKPLRILVAEDSEDDFLLVVGELRAAGFEVTGKRVENSEQMRQALDDAEWDLVLSDFTMPGFDGMSALQVLQESGQPEVPFIIVSGSIGEVRAVEALKAGAANYVMKEHLEKLVPVVERELKDAQVRQERKKAFEELSLAVKARDDFLSIASHELRTPLTSLSLQVQSLLKAIQNPASGAAISPEQMQAKVESVARSSGRLTLLIDRLLDITRVTTGHLKLAREEVDLVGLVREGNARLEDALRVAGSTLSVRSPTGVVGHWDRERLETVVSNLMMNAIKFGEGKPIDVEVEDLDEEACLRVVDRGLGISPEDQDRIFNRFERAVPERHFGGFGVGLWLARQIVEAHGGKIQVQSAPGAGSTFTVTLPKKEPRR
jgi:signal transduction histidine kinase